MGEFLSYSILSSLLLLAMYLAYRLFLARDNQHGFNRGVLLSIYFVSFTAWPFMFWSENLHADAGSKAQAMERLTVVATDVAPISEPVWGTLLIWLFMAGMAVVTIKTVITWARLTEVIRKGEIIRQDGYTLVVTNNERFAPFSWMHYVVISRSDYENNCPAITAHELRHVECRHWIDLLIAQIVCIINWFNPAAWLMRDELMLVHEYQADMAVIESGHDSQEYQMLLIKKAVGARFPSLANSLNHSKLKKRITMMYKEKSGAGRKFKALALVPMLALAFGVASLPPVHAAVSTIGSSDVSLDKQEKAALQSETQNPAYRVTEITSDGKETKVSILCTGFGNNIFVSGCSLTSDGKTYQANSMGCNMSDGTATVNVAFPVAGKLKNAAMKLMVNGKEASFSLENEKLVAIVTPNKHSDNDIKVIGVGTIKKDNSSIVSVIPNDSVSVYLDGTLITEAEMKNISPDKIESISVVKRGNAIIITSKK